VSAYWCELAWLGGEQADAGVVVETDGERIAAVTPGTDSPPAGAERLDGLTLPGFANAHSHAFHRALRARTQAERGSFWTWREQMYAVAARLDPDSYLALARAVYGEMAMAGMTSVGEFHYLHHARGGTPYDEPNEMGLALIEAARQAGIRITLLDTCYLRGGFDAELDEVQRRFADADAEAWAERTASLQPGDGALVGAAIHSVRAVDPESAATVAVWANGLGLPLHAHVSEQEEENSDCIDAIGRSPAGVLEHAGALSERFTAVHFTHPEDGDVRRLGRADATCCLCPTTERDLADGIGQADRMRSAGIALALGSDSNAAIDHFEEARAVELDERLDRQERGLHTAADLLRAATANGHACIGWHEAGTIEAGALADLTTLSLDSVRLAGVTPATALESAVFAATAADVRTVIVGGKPVVRDGAHLELDVAAELRDSIARLQG
jgi:formiminoglutamate deiminase